MKKIYVAEHKKTNNKEIFVIKEMNDEYFVADHYYVRTEMCYDAANGVRAKTDLSKPETVKKKYTIDTSSTGEKYISIRGYWWLSEVKDLEKTVENINNGRKSDYEWFLYR